VDRNIPSGVQVHKDRFALIVGNEDYSSYQPGLNKESNVTFARNDAGIVKQYFEGALGISSDQIDYYLDATAGQMKQAVDRLAKIIKNTNGRAEVFVYYAGHGLPDENKDAYLIPVDITGNNVQGGIKLSEFYAALTEYPSNRVTVFLDACFSGASRGQELMAMRGVKIKPNYQTVQGNMVVFAASTGEQGSLPYHDKQHGIFTYFLLKKIQESNGFVTYQELGEYLQTEVGLKSVVVNRKEQNPTVLVSPEAQGSFSKWNLRP
jgi:uncharacterized caspase-like protein